MPDHRPAVCDRRQRPVDARGKIRPPCPSRDVGGGTSAAHRRDHQIDEELVLVPVATMPPLGMQALRPIGKPQRGPVMWLIYSSVGPHQPGKKSASWLRASLIASSSAPLKSRSTDLRPIRRRKKSAHKNSLNGVVSLAKPPTRRNSPASERNGSSTRPVIE